MQYSLIQEIMIEKILDSNSNIRLYDFYDVYAYDLIEDTLQDRLGSNYNKVNHTITTVDIIKVVSYLINRNMLSDEDIHNFALYLNDVFKPTLMSDKEFVLAYQSICDKLKYEIANLEVQIRRSKNKEKVDKEVYSLNDRIDNINYKRGEILSNRRFIKISISELEKIKLSLSLNEPINKPKNKKDLLIKKHNKQQLKQNGNDVFKPVVAIDEKTLKAHQGFQSLILDIDDDSKTDKEIQAKVVELISSIDVKEITDDTIKKDVIAAINRLKEHLKDTNRDYKNINKEIKNLSSVLNTYKSIKIIPDNVLEDYKEHKKKLNIIYSILDSLKEDIKYTSNNLKYAIFNERDGKKSENVNKSKKFAEEVRLKNGYIDLEKGDKDHFSKLGYYSDQQDYELEAYSVLTFDNFKPKGTILESFFLKSDSGKPINHNYTMSVERHDDKQTIVRMHVLNIYPYMFSGVAGFWSEYFYNSFNSIENNEILFSKIANNLKFKEDAMYPTIAYSFYFNDKYELTKFNIENKGIKIRDINNTEEAILTDAYHMNNQDHFYKSQNALFEGLLKNEFIKYATTNNLPVIYYGRYSDNVGNDLKKGKKVGYEKLIEKAEELSSILDNYDRKSHENVWLRWFKNYRMKHFSLKYYDDYVYFMDDLSLLKPACCMGYNLQKVINKSVFENHMRTNNESLALAEEQKKLVSSFNNACGYIDLDDFVKMISDVVNMQESQRRGSK